MNRQDFMDLFRDNKRFDDLGLTKSDKEEIFLDILQGSSDLDVWLLERLCKNYGKSLGEVLSFDDAVSLQSGEYEISKVNFDSFVNELKTNIGFEKSKDITPPWTEEYREGFVDGLKRADELLEDSF